MYHHETGGKQQLTGLLLLMFYSFLYRIVAIFMDLPVIIIHHVQSRSMSVRV